MGESVRGDLHSDLLLAVHEGYGSEIAKLKMQLAVYRGCLVEHGIEPPDREGQELLEMWQSCKRVIAAAQSCVAQLGTSKELLAERWR